MAVGGGGVGDAVLGIEGIVGGLAEAAEGDEDGWDVHP